MPFGGLWRDRQGWGEGLEVTVTPAGRTTHPIRAPGERSGCAGDPCVAEKLHCH